MASMKILVSKHIVVRLRNQINGVNFIIALTPAAAIFPAVCDSDGDEILFC